jgi:transposase
MTPHTDSFLDPCPPVPTPTLPPSSVLSEALQVCHPHAAGIDLGEAEHGVAVPPGCAPHPVRRVGTCTADLDALAAWRMDCGVTTVAMASTGVSWMPWCARVETRGVQGLLIDPRHATRAPGRPTTDRLDGQGLHRLHTSGLLAGAFRPDDQGCVLRSSVRHRQRLLTSAAHPLQHRHKALQQMPLTRTPVVSDLTGATGMALLTAIIAGERDPVPLAPRRTPHCQHDADDIAKALQGPWRAEPLCALPHAVALSACSHQHLALCDRQSTAPLETCADTSAGQPLPPTARRHKQTNAPRCDARTPLARLAGVDLTTLEGSEANTALLLLRAIGTDRHRWPRVPHCCSWRGLCPQHKISGGKVLSRRVRPGAHRGTVALRLAARRVHHAQSALGAFFRRRPARLGTPKAITATAHTLARLVESLLPHGSASVHQGLDASEAQYHERKVKAMARHAPALGSPLVALAAPAGQGIGAVPAPTPSAGTTRRRWPTPLGERGSCLRHQAQSPPADPVTHAITPSLSHERPTLTGKFLGRLRLSVRPACCPTRPQSSIGQAVALCNPRGTGGLTSLPA